MHVRCFVFHEFILTQHHMTAASANSSELMSHCLCCISRGFVFGAGKPLHLKWSVTFSQRALQQMTINGKQVHDNEV